MFPVFIALWVKVISFAMIDDAAGRHKLPVDALVSDLGELPLVH